MEKVVQGLYMAASSTYYSPAVALDGNNCAMFEGWKFAGGGTVTVTMECSNDQANWDAAFIASTISMNVNPFYGKVANTTVIPYSYVRLKLVSDANTALVDAAIRVFQTA